MLPTSVLTDASKMVDFFHLESKKGWLFTCKSLLAIANTACCTGFNGAFSDAHVVIMTGAIVAPTLMLDSM
jgi:hypothetical protein